MTRPELNCVWAGGLICIKSCAMMQYFCQVCSQFDIEHDTDNLNVKSEFKKLKAFDFQKKLRGLDGRGHL